MGETGNANTFDENSQCDGLIGAEEIELVEVRLKTRRGY